MKKITAILFFFALAISAIGQSTITDNGNTIEVYNLGNDYSFSKSNTVVRTWINERLQFLQGGYIVADILFTDVTSPSYSTLDSLFDVVSGYISTGYPLNDADSLGGYPATNYLLSTGDSASGIIVFDTCAEFNDSITIKGKLYSNYGAIIRNDDAFAGLVKGAGVQWVNNGNTLINGISNLSALGIDTAVSLGWLGAGNAEFSLLTMYAKNGAMWNNKYSDGTQFGLTFLDTTLNLYSSKTGQQAAINIGNDGIVMTRYGDNKIIIDTNVWFSTGVNFANPITSTSTITVDSVSSSGGAVFLGNVNIAGSFAQDVGNATFENEATFNAGLIADTVKGNLQTDFIIPLDSASVRICNELNSQILICDGIDRLGSINAYFDAFKGVDFSAGNYYEGDKWYRSTIYNPQCLFESLDEGLLSLYFAGSGAIGSEITWGSPIFTIDSLGSVEFDGGLITPVTTVNASTYTVLASDYILHVTYTATGACAITIPTALNQNGRTLIIKDAGFNGSANNIIIDCEDAGDKIDGSVGGATISSDANAINLYCDGTDWFII